MARIHAHNDSGHLSAIDRLAHRSRLRPWNAMLKLLFSVALLLSCVAARSPAVSLFLVVTLAGAVCGLGGTPVRTYLALLRIPMAFILLGALAIVLEASWAPVGSWQLRLGSLYLCASPESLQRGGTVLTTALGAVSAMYLLALTTPIHEITSTLSRLHVPGMLIELMYLIYRFIFLLSETAHQMHMAAQSRLGYWGWRQSMQTFGKSMANLLVTALRQASSTYDAMVARCYDGRLAFWTEEKPVTPMQIVAAGGEGSGTGRKRCGEVHLLSLPQWGSPGAGGDSVPGYRHHQKEPQRIAETRGDRVPGSGSADHRLHRGWRGLLRPHEFTPASGGSPPPGGRISDIHEHPGIAGPSSSRTQRWRKEACKHCGHHCHGAGNHCF